MMPAMVNMEGFILSHTVAQTEIPDQAQGGRFLPLTDIPHRLGEVPHTLGQMEIPHQTEMHRWQHHSAMLEVPRIYAEIQDEFETVFGRRLADAVVPYRTEDAETLIVSMGTIGATAERVVDELRDRRPARRLRCACACSARCPRKRSGRAMPASGASP